ncbi:MAG TPA: PAS domain-containing sensor histidine kinase [Balneolales bacterium]|nr:PAS domain-containing sensor histidine kinase [Balneolales bacterium]
MISFKEMATSNYNYELYFDLSPDLLCIAGYDGYFKKINPAVSKLLEYSMDELYAKPINDFVYGDDKDVTEKVRDDLRSSQPLYHFENRYQTKSGKIVWLTWTSFPIESDHVIFAIAKDITYKKKLEQERNELLALLSKTNQDLKELSYTTSHDLRSPVSGLISIFDLIDTSLIEDQQTIELLEIVKLAGEKLEQTLNNYVDVLSEEHNQDVSVEELDLQESLNNVLQSIRYLVQTSKVTIHSDFSGLPKVRFNKAYLESIFLNLITNSIKYAQPDSLPVITIRTEKVNGTGQLIFGDNGLGFDMEKVKGKIFGLHQKFHNHSDSKGIGLYLVHNHIARMGGHIKVESEVNKGTRFIITFAE